MESLHNISLLRFALNPSEVGSKMEGVPIKETMLSDMCPDIESAFCFPHKYRTINGECNNVKNPTWGITGAAYLRILEPTYEDGELTLPWGSQRAFQGLLPRQDLMGLILFLYGNDLIVCCPGQWA